MPTGLRVIVAEDSVLMREGIVRVLADAGFEIVAQAGDADELRRTVSEYRPDMMIVDIRMPPTGTDDGLRAALELRRLIPEIRVVVLSQYVEERYVFELIDDGADGTGYLLKDRIADVEGFVDTVRRVAAGGSALDPEVVWTMLGGRRADPLVKLSGREREVLALIAEGRSNRAIAERLAVTEGAVEKNVTHIFTKLGIAPTPDNHRRVLAVLTFLRASG
jgi:DNA-binding NarL/FixJ family response regulator